VDGVYSGPAESKPRFECPPLTQKATETEELHNKAAKATKIGGLNFIFAAFVALL
jgi:hypothetical protein